MNKSELERLYLTEHLTLAEIGEIYGKTRQTVYYWVNVHKIDTSTAERFNVLCDFCGKEFSITRKKWRSSKKHFHNGTCRIANMKSNKHEKVIEGKEAAH